MKLLFLVNVDWFFLSHRLPIAMAAMAAGYEVHLACSFTDRKDEIEALGIIVHDLPISRSGAAIFQEAQTILTLYSLLKETKPDIVHAVTIKPVLYGGMVARILGISSFVAAVSGVGLVFVAEGLLARLRKYLVKNLYRLAINWRGVKVIFQNSSDVKVLQSEIGLASDQFEIINGSGVDLEEYLCKPEPEGDPVVVMAARLLKEKGVYEFIAAAKLIKESGIKARFLLLGEPDYGNPNSVTSSQIDVWRQENIVEFLGHRNDIPHIFSDAHVVVHPSYYGEGLPKVLIEAAACGRAVITTENPGCMAAVKPNITAIIVPVKDAISLAHAMRTLIDDITLRVEMGRQGRILAEEKFSIKTVVEQHLKIYRELLGISL